MAYPERVANYLIRVQLPDRPGALGAVASRIGSVGADVVSIEILQREGGVVIDELGVGLAGTELVDLLCGEILEVDGATVEAVRPVDGPLPDQQANVLEVATSLFEQRTPTGVMEYLATHVQASLLAGFAAALGPEAPWPVAAVGAVPDGEELHRLADRVPDTAEDLAVVVGECVVASRLVRAGLVLVVGRPDLVFRARERQRVAAMAELADHRWHELASPSSPA